ncbi:MAG: flagellar export chaperone FlgN [Planctomycetota bacterium]|nr:flagellar export chaperone FlgN [Planctomycetota bacterium]
MNQTTAIANRLTELLDALTREHETLLSLCGQHLEAIRQADHRNLAEVVQQQAMTLQRVAELEEERVSVVNDAMRELRPVPPSPTLTAIAQSLPAEQGKQVHAKAQRLRTLMQRLANEQNVVTLTTKALLAHMEGLMRQVARELSHAGTYCNKGYVQTGAAVVSALDVRS